MSANEHSLESVIRHQRYMKNRDQFLYRMAGEDGLVLSQNPVYGIDLDRDGDPILFPGQGPIRAHQYGFSNFNNSQI